MYSNIYENNSHTRVNFFSTDLIRSKDEKPVQRGSISDDKPGGKSKLTLLKVTPADSGDYLCVSACWIKAKASWQKLECKTYFHVKIYSM